MLNDWAYNLIVSILEIFMWDGELLGEENLGEGPGVIVANHMGSIGPVGICVSMPMRLYPWVLGATVDPIDGPENVRKDFVEKILRLKPPLSENIAKGLCKISTPLLLSIGCIPVPDHQSKKRPFEPVLTSKAETYVIAGSMVNPSTPNWDQAVQASFYVWVSYIETSTAAVLPGCHHETG
jgi:hypothetical protein